MNRRSEHQRHREGGDGKAGGEFAAQDAEVAGRGGIFVGVVKRADEGVARVFDGAAHIGNGGDAGDMLYGGALGGEVDAGRNDAWDIGKRALDVADAGGAGHAAYGEGGFLGGDAVAGVLQCVG